MLSSLRKFISWAFLKLVFGAFLAASSVTIYALWLFQHDEPDFTVVQARHQAALQARQLAVQVARDSAEQEGATIAEELGMHQKRAERAASIAQNLREMQSWREWLLGNREQQRLNAVRIEDLLNKAKESVAIVDKRKRELAGATDRLAACVRERQWVDEQLALAVETDSRVIYYLNAAWQSGRWVFVGLLALYFFGPTLRKLVLFLYCAPRIARGRPVLLANAAAPFPSLGETGTVVEASLWPGETARVRKRYLMEVEAGLASRSSWLLSWRHPLTSLLSGFVHDVNLHNARVGRNLRLAFAHHKNPENQMAVVHVPEGGSLVVRPSFLAGVVFPPGQKLGLRRRWQLFRWQSWVTGQLCFLEFYGPCRLIVAGRPGLRAERLVPGADATQPVCRMALDKLVGFSPNLEYRLIRTLRFWNYYRWDARLFDASFVGEGFVLIQTCLPGRSPGMWSATRNRARKVLGL